MYKLIKTEDNSFTFYNSLFKDYYHNKKGALSESYFSFLKPIEKFLKEKNNFIIFDIGFGLGYNSFLIKEFLEKNKKNFIIFSFEKDKNLLYLIEKNKDLLPNKEKNKVYNKFIKEIKIFESKIEIELKEKEHYLIIGDVRKEIFKVKKLIENEKFSSYYFIVLHDGFSPNKNKELWSFEFLTNFYGYDIFITYTNHPKVRSSLLLNNFFLFKTNAFGRKNGGTLGLNKKMLINENLFEKENLNIKELLILLTSYGKPYFDFLKIDKLNYLTTNDLKKEKNLFILFSKFFEKLDYLETQKIIKSLLVNKI